jgi:hypothetical protein
MGEPKLGGDLPDRAIQAGDRIAGPLALSPWISNRDTDIFATVRNIAPDGHDVLELGQQGQLVPMTRASSAPQLFFLHTLRGALPV